MTLEITVILLGALAGGFVSGLTGFGTGLTALPVWLLVLPPIEAGSLVVLCSIFGQLQSLPKVWHAISWPRTAPFVAGGIIGVPIGTWALLEISSQAFRLTVGALMALYCGTMLLSRGRRRLVPESRSADAVVGLAGGIFGGIAGLSGALPTLWTGLRGWNKDTRRAVFQSFNLIILTLAAFAHAMGGLFTTTLGLALLIALPGTIVGVWLGHGIYRRVPDAGYDRIVLVVLALAGVTMVAANLPHLLSIV